MLNANEISVRYPTGWKLGPLSLEVKPGEWIGVLGANGSGKSTLLRALAGILPIEVGQLSWGGQPAEKMTPRAWAQAVAWVDSNASVLFPFTVEEMVIMGRTPHDNNRWGTDPKDRAVVDAALSRMELQSLRTRPVQMLSSGERQRVWIARGLAQESDLLLLDEPQAHLDIAHSWTLFKTLQALRAERPFAMVATLHDIHLAAAVCDRLLLMKDGTALTPQPIPPSELPNYVEPLFGNGMPAALFTPDLLNKLRKPQDPSLLTDLDTKGKTR